MKNTILLVDDNPANLAVLYDHLSQADYNIVVVDNGIDAVERAVQVAPALILLDIRMPGMDGYETCRAIKSNATLADVPTIFLSALAEEADRLKGFEAGGVDFVTKPLNVPEVTARIDTHITLARLRQALQASNEQLEARVAERTVALSEEVARHQQEIARRKQAEVEKQQLLRLLREQNKQLHAFTNWLLQSRPAVRLELTQLVSQQLLDSLASVSAELKNALKANDAATSVQHTSAASLRVDQMHRFLRTIVLSESADDASLPIVFDAPLANLSERERTVLTLIADGATSGEIAERLAITETTVRSYRVRLMRKLDIHNIPGLVKFALLHNLTDLRT